MISAVIVNYNGGAFLNVCLQSVLAQADEIIVVDNASSDHSIDQNAQHFAEEPKLKIIRNDTNLGFAVACNIGIRHASGTHVLFLNPDCRLDPTAVSELMHVLNSENIIGMVGGFLVNPDGSEQGGGRRAVPTPWRSLVRASGLTRFAKRWPKLFFDFHLHKQPVPSQPIEVEAISGACMLVKREAMDIVGLWDENYFLHCEDLDWCMRFRKMGWKIMFVPSARVAHEHGASSRSRPIFVEWHKHKGMVRFYKKFFRHQYPSILMWLVITGVWLRFILIAISRSLKQVFSTRRRIVDNQHSHDLPVPAAAPVVSSSPSTLQHVGVLGAASMVGECLLPILTHTSWKVIALSRRTVRQTDPHVEWRQVASPPTATCLQDAGQIASWICLAPLRILPDYFDLMEAHGVKRVVALSSTSRFTKTESSDPDERKFVADLIAAEEALRNWAEARNIEWIILRPTLIYGLGMDKNVSMIARLILRFGFFPLLGAAQGLRQPIHALDVAQACLAALDSPAAANHSYNISGAEILSYREMVVRIFAALGLRPRLVPVPLGFFRFAVACMKILPRYRKLSPAMAERMNQNMNFDHDDAARDLHFSPRPFSPVMEDLIGKPL